MTLRTVGIFLGVLVLGCGTTPPAGSGGTGGGGSAGGGNCDASALRPGESTASLQVGGTTRRYVLYVPASYTGQTPVPLVLDFHGLFLNGAQQRALSGYAELAEREGFIVAFPDGIDNAWNIGPCCTFSRSVDDVGFARALVAKLQSEGCIDPKRVYAAGYSMGGGMSYHLACQAGDLFAAVAPAAFDLLQEMTCTPSRPISVIAFRGTSDAIVPYAGGPSRPPNGLNTTIHFLGAESTFQKWATLNQCSGQPAQSASGCSTYAACSGGVETTLCTATLGGHVPGDAAVGWAALKRFQLP